MAGLAATAACSWLGDTEIGYDYFERKAGGYLAALLFVPACTLRQISELFSTQNLPEWPFGPQ